ncbi:MAG: hypothetical protein VB111_10260 [Clostridiaceae bacterium]|nr:hypothetical protein [Clostridiaceae bacterium]
MLQFSIARKEITPSFSFVQQGFAARKDPWTSIHDPLFATVCVWKAEQSLLIATFDLVSGTEDFSERLYALLHDKFDIPRANIILSYTHTHSALGANPLSENADIQRYSLSLVETVCALTAECLSTLKPCTLSVCRAESSFGISRRFPSSNGILWKPYPDPTAADPTLYLLKITDNAGTPVCLIYQYGCHATACGPSNLAISADFPGAVRYYLEKKNPGCTVMFLQGCGADEKPVISSDGERFISLQAEEMWEKTKVFADEIEDRFQNGKWREVEVRIEAKEVSVTLPCERWEREQWEAIANNPSEPLYRRNAAQKAVNKLEQGLLTDGLSYTIRNISMGDDLRWICLENEVVNGYAKKIRRRLHGDILVLGYTGKICCYIPTAQIAAEGGYERNTFIAAGTKGPFLPETEEVILCAATK